MSFKSSSAESFLSLITVIKTLGRSNLEQERIIFGEFQRLMREKDMVEGIRGSMVIGALSSAQHKMCRPGRTVCSQTRSRPNLQCLSLSEPLLLALLSHICQRSNPPKTAPPTGHQVFKVMSQLGDIYIPPLTAVLSVSSTCACLCFHFPPML